jgi:exodeoxyribonuclease-3
MTNQTNQNLKLISWNVNGIRAILNKGFNNFMEEESPDIICIQETKAHP